MDTIQLIAIDLDGTLLTDSKEIDPANLEAIGAVQEAGYQVVVATGRSYPGTRPFTEALPRHSGRNYAIINNGGTTLTLPDYGIHRDYRLDWEGVAQAWEFFQAHSDSRVQFTLTDFDRFYLVEADDPLPAVLADATTLRMPIHKVSLEDIQDCQDFHKIVLMGEPAALDQVQAQLPGGLQAVLTPVRSLPFLLELLRPGVNKAQALVQLTQDLGLAMSQVMAIGDQVNDREMLEAAGFAVAMSNAVPEIKALADRVTLSNNEAGVAAVLRDLLAGNL